MGRGRTSGRAERARPGQLNRSVPIWRDANRLLLEIEQAVRHFPRYHKYTLGSELRAQAMRVCRLVVRAWHDRARAPEILPRLVSAVDDLKIQIQLAKELRAQAPPDHPYHPTTRSGAMWKNLIPILMSVALPGVAAAACNANAPETTPTARFVDNGDGTATDTATGLMWKRCPEGYAFSDDGNPFGADSCSVSGTTTYTWQGALDQAAAVNGGSGYAGHGDWRVANLKELLSIAEDRCWTPAINAVVFPNTPSSYFWSASPSASIAGTAWNVYFYYGNDGAHNKNANNYVRLVRAGQ